MSNHLAPVAQAEPVELVTEADAAALCAALDALKAISDRAGGLAYKTPSNGIDVRAQDYGRLSGCIYAADSAVFTVLNVASNYCQSAEARAAMRQRLDS